MNVAKRVAERSTERVEQKERTRQKLLAAARALAQVGGALTITRIARHAGVAEATAYRYYSNPRSLLRDALAIDWSGLESLIPELAALPHPADRAQRAAEEIARFVLDREINIRMLFASTDREPRDRAMANGLPGRDFRSALVDAVLQGMEMHAGMRRSIELELIVIISPHAVLTLRDAIPSQGIDLPTHLGLMARRAVSALAD